jgi:hypothetical protein
MEGGTTSMTTPRPDKITEQARIISHDIIVSSGIPPRLNQYSMEEIITRHITAATKDLEDELEEKNKTIENFDSAQRRLMDENARLREALLAIVASWNRHGPRIIESRGGLQDNRVNEVNESIEQAEKALT